LFCSGMLFSEDFFHPDILLFGYFTTGEFTLQDFQGIAAVTADTFAKKKGTEGQHNDIQKGGGKKQVEKKANDAGAEKPAPMAE
jgi:hypothetical protein